MSRNSGAPDANAKSSITVIDHTTDNTFAVEGDKNLGAAYVQVLDGSGNPITNPGSNTNITKVGGQNVPTIGSTAALPVEIIDENGKQITSLAINDQTPSQFVQSKDAQFILKGQSFKYASFNYYLLAINNSKSATQAILDDFKKIKATVVRTWCFDGPMGFRSLFYPLGTNLAANHSFETGDFTSWTEVSNSGFDWTVSTDTAEDGTYAAKLDAAGGFTYFGQQITVVANTNYLLNFWHKTTNRGGNPSRVIVGTTIANNDVHDGGYIPDSAGVWEMEQVQFNSGAHTSAWITFQNFGGSVLEYIDNVNVSVQSGTPYLGYNEPALINLDMVLDEAGKRDIKLILSLADGNFFSYNTKGMYVDWANTIYGLSLDHGQHSTDFYTNVHVKNLYKDFIRTLIQRVNTINGKLYRNDPAIFSWELGNELRAEASDPGNVVNTQNSPNFKLLSAPGGWTDEMSTYIHSYDPNHMINFGDMGHNAQYLQDNQGSPVGDAVYNGTYDGISYTEAILLPYISFLDFHIYPTQNDGVHLAANSGKYWGQKFGYNNGPSGDGFRAQLADYVKVAHAANKPCACTETGEDSAPIADNSLYPLYNRYTYFKNFFSDFLDIAGGDGVNIWHSAAAATSGSYDVALEATGGAGITDNSNDTDIVNLVKSYNTSFLNDIAPAQSVRALIKTNGDIISKTLNPNDATVSVQLADTWTGTVQFEYTIDGITWYPLILTSNAGDSVTSTTAIGLFTGSVSGMNQVRVRASASITGSLTVNIQSSPGMITPALTQLFAAISASSSGDNTIVSAVTGKKIRVLNGVFIASGAVNVKFLDGTGGTPVTGVMNCVSNSGAQIPYSPIGNFQTSAGNALVLNLSGATAVGGWLTYIAI